ncbi:MAG: serine/threonine-protein kinase [Pseudomonadales bacterium]
MDRRAEQKQILEAFERALEAPDPSAWLEASALPRPIVDGVRRLLESQDRSEVGLPTPAAAWRYHGPEAAVGDTVGSYRLERELGAGGMGRVFLATRIDGEFRQQAAVKIARASLLDRGLLRLFHSERQILADLKHPNIAMLYDGGTIGDQVPYVVMEYVDGVPLDAYVAEHELSVESTLQLFLRVLDAVQRAHQSLIVHRDLKPGNVLVTADGTPKLLDFGVAAQLFAERGDATAAPAMTTAYASPEQLRGRRSTTASDVYSLGVVLYELLAGQRPFDDGLTPVQLSEAIGHGAPAPSQRVARAPVQRAARLRGDLDRILLHAIDEDPDRRYPTAGALAADIQRYLKREPVTVTAPTRVYRLRKFIARHPLGVGASGAGLAVLLGLVGALLVQVQIARQERDRAEEYGDFLTAAIIAPVKALSPAARVVEPFKLGLDATINDLWQALEARATSGSLSPEASSRILLAMAHSFFAQDRWEASERTARRARAILESQALEAPDQLFLAGAHIVQSMHRQQKPGTGREYERLLETFATADLQDPVQYALFKRSYAVWQWEKGETERAAMLLNEVLEALSDAATPDVAYEYAFTLANAGLLDCQVGNVPRCLGRLDRAIEMLDEGGFDPLPQFHRARAGAAGYVGDIDAMLRHALTAEAVAREVFPNTIEHARSLRMVVSARIYAGDFDLAAAGLDELDGMEADLLPEDHFERADAHVYRARLRLARGDPEGALAAIERARHLRSSIKSTYDTSFSSYDAVAADALLALGRLDEAQPLAQRALDYREALYGDELAVSRRAADTLTRIEAARAAAVGARWQRLAK